MQRRAAFECIIRRRLLVDPNNEAQVSVLGPKLVRAKILGSHLLAAEDKTLLHRRDALLLFYLLLDLRDLSGGNRRQ